ncbi:MAG: phosphate signaling complex protein PhoU [Acidobacteria bacterium]|nr:phosphate signaling complex protein PhoU [Acidobacteriota bacterium]
MSKHLQIEIERLKKRVLAIGVTVVEAIQKALLALEARRAEIAAQVMEGDKQVDTAEVELEEECLKLLALYQPVAEDLRFITAVMKINNDLERMGDEAVNIAEHASFLARNNPISVPPQLSAITAAAMRMVRESLDAFVQGDVQAARRICAEDDEVDGLNREIINAVWRMMQEDPQTVERATHLFSVSRHLERIADHATNIAEDVVYMVEGKIIRHHFSDYSRQPENE